VARRLACVRQQTPADCGAACLATIASHYGLPLSAGTARLYTGTDQAGTSVLGLVQGARSLGIEAKALRAKPEALDEISLPAVAHVVREGLYHYVVIHSISGSQMVVADPAEGVCRLTRQQFLSRWTGILVAFEPPAKLNGNDKPAGPCLRLLRLLAPFKHYVAETFIASIFLALLGFSFAFYLQIMVDRLARSGGLDVPMWLSFALLGVIGCRFAFALVRGFLLAHIARKVDLTLITDYYCHLIQLPMSFFQGVRVGDVISRLIDAVKMREMVGGSSLAAAIDSACILSGFAILAFYSWKLTLLTAALLLPLTLLLLLFNRPLRKYQRQALDHAGRVQSHFVEGFSGISTIRAFSAETESAHRMERALVPLLNTLFRTNITGLMAGGLGELIAGAGMTVVLWAAGKLVITNQLSIGKMVSFYSVLLLMLQPLLRLLSINYSVQDSLVSANRLGELMDLPIEEPRAMLMQPPEDRPCEVRFFQVTFRYGARARVLNGINLVIPACGATALVGESGSGKSTLIRLLLREFDPEEGLIELAGQNLKEMDPHGLRRQFGYVPQDPFFFSGTIKENLCVGGSGFSAADLADAVRAAGLSEFIESLPGRYDTPIGEGGLILSGGQRQRLAIARMLIHKPRLALLDEPTSNVDALTEQVLLRTIVNMAKQRPVLIVAHRLSTIRFADRIAVMDRGRIVESGTHSELIARRGRYFSLWETQVGCDLSCKQECRPPQVVLMENTC
jgi:ABC-type bacteriocin/lantibiotic exporter with double-glycine peptidase domain